MPTQNSSPKTFNLVDQPWIPVACEHELRSLLDFFTVPAPKRLSGNAVDKIAVFRFLLSIVHATLPSESPNLVRSSPRPWGWFSSYKFQVSSFKFQVTRSSPWGYF